MRELSKGLLAAVAVLALASSAQAASTWTFGGGTCSAGCNSDAGSDAGSPKVKASAFYTSLSGTNNFASYAISYSGGAGLIVESDGSISPNHAVDNKGNLEMVLLRFDSKITLNQLNIGWTDSNYDSDVMVLAYMGNTSFATDALAATAASNSVTGKKVSDLATTPAAGWKLVGSYADVGTGTESINSGGISSSWWLVSAYNSTIGGTVSSNGGNLSNGGSSSNSAYDYVKLLAVGGLKGPSGAPGVPEPGSLALAGLALFGMTYTRRRMQRNS